MYNFVAGPLQHLTKILYTSLLPDQRRGPILEREPPEWTQF